MPTTPLNTPSADLLDLPSANAPAALGATASSGTSNTPSASDHVHQIPALTGDVTKTAGDGGTTVEKIRGKTVSAATPSTGNVLQWDGSNIVWAAPAAGGSGGGGVTFYFNFNTTVDNPTAGLPTLDNSVLYKELGRAPEAAATTVTSVQLINSGNYSNVCGFVTDVMDPDSLTLPRGLWDFNVWCYCSDDAQQNTTIRATVYQYKANGTYVSLGTSAHAALTNVSSLVTLSLTVEQRTLDVDDRIAVILEASSSSNNKHIVVEFGGSKPSHTHTTIPSVGGTGLVRVVDGVIQSQGAKVLNSDFADGTIASAKIANSGVSAGTYGALTKIPVLTVNAQGQVTSASEQNIAGTSTVSRVAWSNLDSSFPYSYSNGTTVEATSIAGSAYANSTFVIVGDTGLVATSTDGITWTKRTTPLGNAVDYCFRDVAYGLSKFVAVSSDSAKNAHSEGSSNTVGGRIITSADGVTWGAAVFTNTYFRPMGVALGVKDGSPAMMAVGTGKLTTTGTGSAVISTDGTTWTEVAEFTTFANSSVQLKPLSVAYGNGKWVVVGKDGVIGYSADTVTWTQATSGVGLNVHLDKVEYLNGKFIIVGYAGTILVSDDGVSWTAKTSGATGINLHSVAYGDSTYYVLGDNNSILISTDLNTWDVEAVPFSYATIDGFTILYANGRFIAGGNNGQLCGGTSVTVTLGSGASFNNTKIVGPFGDAPTIQGCINLINDASISKHYTILVPTGTYTENLVLRANISISGISNGNLDNGVTIIGKHTYSGLSNQVSANKVWFSNLYFVYPVASDQPAANIFTFGGNYVASANFRNCTFAGGMVNGSHITANQNFIIRIDSCKFENSATTVDFSNIVANGADVYLWGTTVIESTGRAIKTGVTLTDLYLTASVGTDTYTVTPLDTTGIAVGMTVYGTNITNGKGVVQSFVANTSITLDSVSTTATTTLCSFNKVTGTLTTGSTLVTSIADSIALINVGDRVYGTGIATNTTVIAKPSGTSIQLSMPSTSSGATLLSFGKYAYVNILGGYINSYGNSTVGCEAIKIQSGLVVGLSTSIGAASTGMNGVNLTGYGATLGLVSSNFVVAKDLTSSYYAVKGGYTTLYAYSGVSYSTVTGIVTYNSSVYTDGGMTSQAYANSAPSTDVRVYSTAGSFTWVKPSGAKSVNVQLFGGGGGGGGGSKNTTTLTVKAGGGGGGGGSYLNITLPASVLNATQTVVVGAGGTAGAGQTTVAVGGAGGAGGNTTFAGLICAGGTGGAGGTAASAAAGIGILNANSGGASSITAAGAGGAPTSATTAYQYGGAGGGAGGSVTAAAAVTTGGNGGRSNVLSQAGGALGAAGVAGTNGYTHSNANTGLFAAGSGGGGGGAGLAAVGGAGGAGGFPAAGGGGGGATESGTTSGAGGVGGAGMVVITTYL